MSSVSTNPRPITFRDVFFGSLISPTLVIGTAVGVDQWLGSPALLSFPLNLAGGIFIILGLSLALRCFKTIPTVPKQVVLVTWGPWARVRHPIYLAELVNSFGLAMLVGTTLLLVAFLGHLLLAVIAAACEERSVRRRFLQEYKQYARRTPGWIPRIRAKDSQTR